VCVYACVCTCVGVCVCVRHPFVTRAVAAAVLVPVADAATIGALAREAHAILAEAEAVGRGNAALRATTCVHVCV
jgi:hypothetical protein